MFQARSLLVGGWWWMGEIVEMSRGIIRHCWEMKKGLREKHISLNILIRIWSAERGFGPDFLPGQHLFSSWRVFSSLFGGRQLDHGKILQFFEECEQTKILIPGNLFGGFHSHVGTPIAGWFMVENPIKIHHLGVPPWIGNLHFP